MTPTRLLLVEDHTLVRAGICALLESVEGVTVVGEAGDGREAVRLARALRPDVVLMDISMPGLNGLEASARITRRDSRVRVLVLSMHSNEEFVAQALASGASGYLIKASATEELEQALNTVAEGEVYLSPRISRRIVQRLLDEGHGRMSSLGRLTPRQREILQLVAEGSSTREIAAALCVSIKTVETHRAQLMARLGIRDVPGLTRFAIRVGLVSPDA